MHSSSVSSAAAAVVAAGAQEMLLPEYTCTRSMYTSSPRPPLLGRDTRYLSVSLPLSPMGAWAFFANSVFQYRYLSFPSSVWPHLEDVNLHDVHLDHVHHLDCA